MATTLVATASVHTTAAACDYLAGRISADDTVLVLTVEEPGVADRDAGDAANVARTRLPVPTVDTLVREGNSATTIEAVADEYEVAQILVGAQQGDPERAGSPPGSTVRALLSSASRPVVVLP
jgi:nucleotide-binding universal stress UspA family protein